MMILPSQSTKKYSQTNSGDFSGNVRQTKNVSFYSKKGYIQLERRTRMISDNSTLTDLITNSGESILKIVTLSTKIWVMGTKTLYTLNSATLTATEDATSGTPSLALTTTSNDMFPFIGNLYVVNGTNTLYYFSSSAWNTVTIAPLAVALCVFENLSSLAMGGGNQVQLLDGTNTAYTTLTLPQGYSVNSMAWNNNKLYIGVYGDQRDGGVFEWDGIGNTWNYFWPVKGIVMSVVKYGIGVAFITSRGELMYLDTSPRMIAAFPIFYSRKPWQNDVNFAKTGGFDRILNGGIVVDRDLIYMAVDSNYVLSSPSSDSTADYFENDFPSGVWCYDPAVGLHHKYSVGPSTLINSGAITTSNVNTSTGVITIPSSICPDTGTPVFYNDGDGGSGTLLTPLSFATRYFVIKLSGMTLKLAASRSDALAGTSIALTGTGNNSQSLQFCPNDDFGGINQQPRALYLMNIYLGGTPATYVGNTLLIGSLIAKGTSFSNTGIHAVASKQENRGYFTTTRMQSNKALTDTFQKIYLKFRPLVNPEDAIIVKYRKVKSPQPQNRLSTPITGTWVTSTTFTTPNVTGMSAGNEVEIVNGAGSGYLAHIVGISAISAGVYTITIDETVQNVAANGTFYYTVDNWRKLSQAVTTSYSTNAQGYAEIQIPDGQQAPGLEVKVELRGQDILIEEVDTVTDAQRPLY